MPIKTRIDMLSTGIKTPVGIKIMGPNLATHSHLASEVANAVKTSPADQSPHDECLRGKIGRRTLLRPLAVPMIGGTVSSFLLELLLHPVIYYLARRNTIGREQPSASTC